MGGEDNFDEYIKRKRQDGVWGDDIELQALSEIYNSPIEIYAYRSEPMRTFHEDQQNNNKPIRLSYHGKEHYNSVQLIIPPHILNQSLQPGVIEKKALEQSRQRKLNRSAA